MATDTAPAKTRTTNAAVIGVIAAIVVIAAILLAGRSTSTETSSALTDGTVVQADDGLVYFVWDGAVQRIQQPAAFSDADLDQLGLAVGDPAPERLTVGEEVSFFAVYPFDGPEAALYLVDGATLHEVQVVDVEVEDVAGVPLLEELVITRVHVE